MGEWKGFKCPVCGGPIADHFNDECDEFEVVAPAPRGQADGTSEES